MSEYLETKVKLFISERDAESDVRGEVFDPVGNIIGVKSPDEIQQEKEAISGKKFFHVKAICEKKQLEFKSIVVNDVQDERFASLSHVLHLIAKSLVKNMSKTDGKPPIEPKEKPLIIV